MDDNAAPSPAADVASKLVETHISTLFFTSERVYKLAKRVDLPFLNTMAASDRLNLALRELELNRRFAPDVYLGLADVEEHGEVIDRMIVMQRLPDSRCLSQLVGDPHFDEHLRNIARRVATIHAAAPPIRVAPMATAGRLADNWHDNLTALRPHVGSIIDPFEFESIERLVREYLSQCTGLFRQRITDGFVRDGHGDLIADDIYCLDDGPRILDCLAFDDDLRIGDVLNDIAFLAMDVHRLAGADAASSLMRWYHEFSNEQHPSSLAHHYVAYRAHVRAKVASLRAGQSDDRGDIAANIELARVYHRLALHHLERARIRVIMVGGGPGVGKTVLAGHLARHFGYVHLATDEIRHDVAGIPHGRHAFSEPGRGPYAPELVDATYDEQRAEAEVLISHGYGVVLDASWTSERHRIAIRDIAAACGTELVEIECQLDEDTAKQRIARRLTDPHDVSDATPDVVGYLAARRDPWPTGRAISTLPDVADVVAMAVALIEGRV
jgi:aminoglycoside phosphotransferase family enzyme/predicted kinase